MRSAIDKVLERVISRKLMAWVVTIILLIIFGATGWNVPDRLLDVFKVVTVTYIGTQGAVDFAQALKGGSGVVAQVVDKLDGEDEPETVDDP